MRYRWLALVSIGVILGQCTSADDKAAEDSLFTPLSSAQSGIDFINTIRENDSLNIVLYEYLYNGGGVAVGDVNNDDQPDLFFTGNQVSSRLYLNKGKLQFEDITDAAGVATNGWCTGASMVDINADGLLDIFVCQTNKKLHEGAQNQLFINNGNNDQGYPTFTESAARYGLASSPDATQAAFFDYDRDGDLDMYLLVHEYDDFNPNRIRPRRLDGSAPNTDRLYRNEGNRPGEDHPFFTDVSQEAGIQIEGYGLGIAISDFNHDLLPDVYVANDYNSNDVLYVNNGIGPDGHPTFTNKIAEWIRHQSNSSMGCDVADFNNDGLVDIITLDMLPRDNKRQKLMIGDINQNRFQMQQNYGYEPQYVRNMLQLNGGLNPEGNPFFSEIGQLAGVYQTGWSWSPLWADFDNDGWKDLFITNGIPKDLTNLDLIAYRQAQLKDHSHNLETYLADVSDYMNHLQNLEEANYVYQNTHDLSFSDQSSAWGVNSSGSSNGAVYADLDNDGDLDLVVNNVNAPATLYRNNLNPTSGANRTTFLKVKTHGNSPNRDGIGAKVWLFYDGKKQYLEQSPYRGFQSSVDRVLHFGLDSANTVDSLKVLWPSGAQQTLRNVPAKQVVVLREAEAAEQKGGGNQPESMPFFREVSDSMNIVYRHQEKPYNDFAISPLLPRMYSRLGPGIAVGDVNGDEREDFFVGGAYRQSGTFFIQQADGTFYPQLLTQEEKKEEDMGCLLFDADRDGDRDLYVVSGSSEYGPTSQYYQDRLYLNDGKGNFTHAPDLLPEISTSGSSVTAADFDRDGDLDVFRGSRIALTKYPQPVKSYLLRNDNGRFVDATSEVAPALQAVGLVSSALWSDVDNDQWPELILVGEWMPITILQNEDGKLTQKITLPQTGWWNTITGGDFDNDGDTDYVVGNLGENTRYRASDEQPLTIIAEDVNDDSVVDGIISAYLYDEQGNPTLYPVHPRNTLTSQVNGFKRVFPDYQSYAQATTSQLFTALPEKDIKVLECNELRSLYLENTGEFQFRATPLPVQAQFAPVFGLLSYDVDGDSNLDIILTGNSYSQEAMSGQYDALNGWVLRGNGKGEFSPWRVDQSGFHVEGDGKGLAYLLDQTQGLMVLAARNDSTLKVFSPRQQAQPMKLLKPAPTDGWAQLYFGDGKERKVEFYCGESYLSQSSVVIPLDSTIVKAVLYDYTGKARTLHF